ncbi:DUF4258 domain-containing protein [Pelotomaculum terephthalicicum JT]|uniref:DUF4258 domain-containing protein n=1 Tax=Pelotomaculum terephthalicicum TaxID=206393 RepID=UPI001F045ED2|nr:DUF4258 domain-containing protein [Pelotomaculum terephthalicicum]MCG9969583.1 DUF4258 domain-containing protein [Pelotomaculum terephthalicicum JT]
MSSLFSLIGSTTLCPSWYEDYPEDQRGHSCLVLGHTKDSQPVHSVCAFDPSGTLIIITAYFPEPPKWKDPKTRGVN